MNQNNLPNGEEGQEAAMNCAYCRKTLATSDSAHVLACRIDFENQQFAGKARLMNVGGYQPCASGAEKSGTFATSVEDAQIAETVSVKNTKETTPAKMSTTALHEGKLPTPKPDGQDGEAVLPEQSERCVCFCHEKGSPYCEDCMNNHQIPHKTRPNLKYWNRNTQRESVMAYMDYLEEEIKRLQSKEESPEQAFGWQVRRVDKSGELARTGILKEEEARGTYASWVASIPTYQDKLVSLLRLQAVVIESAPYTPSEGTR